MKANTIKLCLTIAMAGICFSQQASATLINDDYVGARYYDRWGDRIGNGTFEVHNMDATLTGNLLTVQINTNYAGHAGLYGTGYGDLFLSSAWTPNGDSALGYRTDDNTNGTNWTYGLSLDGDLYNNDNTINKQGSARFNNANISGTASLYELNSTTNDDNVFLSDDLTSYTFRNGQEVAVDRSSNTTADTGIDGSWMISSLDTDDYIRFEIDLSGTGLANSTNIALHWGMTCGNDTIEGEYAVPEPAILGLLAAGLIGIGVSKRKNT
jgi:hypothetical protein